MWWIAVEVEGIGGVVRLEQRADGENGEDVSVGEHDAKRPNTADAPAVADERGVASPSVATFVALRPRRLLRLQSLANTLHLASEPSRNTRSDDVIQWAWLRRHLP